MAWLSGDSKRQAIVLTGGSSGAQVDFQLALAIAYDSDMLSDFSDIRFTKEDGTTLIDAWLEDKTDDTSADVYVEFPSTPDAGVKETKGYMYYGKSDALSDWDIGATFLFGDDFEDGTLNKWDTIGSPTATVVEDEGSNVASIKGPTYSNLIVNKVGTFDNFVLDAKVKMNAGDQSSCQPLFLIRYTDVDNKYLLLLTGETSNYMFLRRYEGGSQYINKDYSFNYSVQYYDFSAIFNGDKIDAWLDDTHLVDYTDTGTGITSGKICLGNYRDGSAAYYDNVRVRKYAANPPTYEFGSEENAPTGLTILDFERAGMRGVMRGIMRGVV